MEPTATSLVTYFWFPYLRKFFKKSLVLDPELVFLRQELPLKGLVVLEQVLNLRRLPRLLDHLLRLGQLLLENGGLRSRLAESFGGKKQGYPESGKFFCSVSAPCCTLSNLLLMQHGSAFSNQKKSVVFHRLDGPKLRMHN